MAANAYSFESIMNILHVTPWKLTDLNGISKVVTMLSRKFLEKGHGVTVLAAGGENRLRIIETVETIVVHDIYLRVPYSKTAPVRALVAFCVFFPFTMYQLFQLLSRLKIDVVVIQFPLAHMFYFAILRIVSRWKLVLVYHGSDAHLLHSWSSKDRRLVKFLLETADCVVAVSKTLHEKVSTVFPGLKLKQSCVVSNGAPLDLIAQADPYKHEGAFPPNYVFSAGHLIHRKGFDIVIEAMRLARDHGVEINLVVAGEGEEREALTQLAGRSGVLRNLYLLGNQSHEQVLRLMKSCLFFVLASRAEGLPLVIAEAMACGKAVVATNVDGSAEIVQDGRTGLLVASDDAPSLAKALIQLSTDSVMRDTLARHGKERALQEYNWEAIANRYLTLFSQCGSSESPQSSGVK